MKKLIFILLLLLISCGGSYQKQEAVSDDSLFVMMNTMDSMNNVTSYQDQILKSIAMDSPIIQPETLLIQKDTIKPSSRKMVQTKLDTTSNLPMIRKNREVIDYQQKQLDSLLQKKK